MEEFFQYDIQDYMPWFEDTIPPVINQSAFVKYEYRPIIDGNSVKGPIQSSGSGNRNIHKRMMAMLTGRRQIPVTGAELSESDRSQRHVISERIRREKQKQCYLRLHSLLPPGTKSDKNSILQTAAKKIEELERVKMELEWKNREIESVLCKTKREEIMEEKAKIKLKMAYPSSGIDSVLEALKRLKQTGSKLRSIQSTISPHELSAVLEFQTNIEEAAQVEKAVQMSVYEVERKFRSQISPQINAQRNYQF